MCTVSVLVPVYNVAAYLRECVDSILNQTFTDFELILCDDGSTDGSGIICDEYAHTDSRVQVIHKRNEGNSPTRRVLLAHVSGEYILFVDSDDLIAPETLEHTVKFAKQTGCDVVMFGVAHINDSGEMLHHVPPLYPDRSVFRGEDRKRVYRDFVSENKMNHLWDKLIARRLWMIQDKSVIGINRSFKGEDKLRLLPVFENAECFGWLSLESYYYRQSITGMGRNFQMHYFSDARSVTEKILQFIDVTIDADPAEKIPVYHHFLYGLSTRVMSCVHCGKFTSQEIKEAFRQERESTIYQDSMRYRKSLKAPILSRLTLWFFDRALDTPMILMLKAEQGILKKLRAKAKS